MRSSLKLFSEILLKVCNKFQTQQRQQQHHHTEFITDFKQITKTSSAKSSYKWKHGKITETTATKMDYTTAAVTQPVRQDLLEPLQIQVNVSVILGIKDICATNKHKT